jgi:hypothetical protein
MPYEQRPGQGSLFKNRDKGNNERAPNLKGTGLLELADGSLIELDIAAWTKESQKAGKWLSLTIKLKQDRPIRQRFNQRVQEMGSDIDDANIEY